MRSSLLCAAALLACALPLCGQETAVVHAADAFQLPVGPNGTGEGYYIARGVRPNGHLGEDWNGVHGGDTDLGDPVYACAHGYVTFARNYHMGWGNVVILRHAYYEGSTLKYCDSLYGHLLDFTVHEGDQVRRGQQIARIGNNFGMYEAHLHFEMRKNLQIGMYRNSFLRDFSNYYVPNQFIAEHHFCPSGNHMVNIPINTYAATPPPVIAGPHVETPVFGPPPAGAPAKFAHISPLPPAGSSPLTPLTTAPKVLTKVSTPTPAPVTPAPKIVKSKPVAATPVPTPTSTPAPTPVVKVFRTGVSPVSTAAATPAPSTAARHTTTVTNTPAEPTVKIIAASTPHPTATRSTASTKPAVTPIPAVKSMRKSSSTTIAATSPTPMPSTRKGARTPSPIATASKATPTPTPTVANATRKTRAASPTPQPVAATNGNSQTIASDPLLPAPTSKAVPLERTGSTYKIDPYGDMRKTGN